MKKIIGIGFKRMFCIFLAIGLVSGLGGCKSNTNKDADNKSTIGDKAETDNQQSVDDKEQIVDQEKPKEEGNITYLTSATFSWLPDGFGGKEGLKGITQYPFKSQYLYGPRPYPPDEQFLVFEAILPEDEVSKVEEKEEIPVGKEKGIVYEYKEGSIPFDLEQFSQMRIPKEGDWVIEWEDEEAHYRLFGTLTKEDLLKIAEGIEVHKE